MKSFETKSFNYDNQSVEVSFTFDDPTILGLNVGKSDKLVFKLNQSYPILNLLTNLTEKDLDKVKPREEPWGRIELTFDQDNSRMDNLWIYTKVFYAIFVITCLVKVALCIYTQVSLMTFWAMIEYA